MLKPAKEEKIVVRARFEGKYEFIKLSLDKLTSNEFMKEGNYDYRI